MKYTSDCTKNTALNLPWFNRINLLIIINDYLCSLKNREKSFDWINMEYKNEVVKKIIHKNALKII